MDESNGCQRNKIGHFNRCDFGAFLLIWFGTVLYCLADFARFGKIGYNLSDILVFGVASPPRQLCGGKVGMSGTGGEASPSQTFSISETFSPNILLKHFQS